jgi:ubiquinone/menaquinone biosynthesis C-methylase UbiE
MRRPPVLHLLLKTFFHLLYHKFAWTYDFVAAVVSLGEWNSWVLSVLPYLSGPDILEIGPGPGHLQIAMRREGFRSFALEASPEMSRFVFERISRFESCILIVNGYAQFIPFSNLAFNQVVSTFPTEYILNPFVLSEIFRILKPGGQVIILPAAWITGQNFKHRLAAGLFNATGQSPAWDNQLSEKLSAAGFIVATEFIEKKSSRLVIITGTKNVG